MAESGNDAVKSEYIPLASNTKETIQACGMDGE